MPHLVLPQLPPEQTHLDEGAHVGKVRVHSTSIGEVLAHPLHQVAEAAVGQLICRDKADTQCWQF